MSDRDAYHELSAYTLTHGGSEFIHQHVVDAFAAQHADETTKPMALTFALVGLYLHVERGLSGRQVQLVHMRLARRQRKWPTLSLPPDRGVLTAADVIRAAEGRDRDSAIHAWCAAVWHAFRDARPIIVRLLHEYGI